MKKNQSYIERWKAWYDKDSTLAEYGDKQTYNIGVDFLKGLAVEDWGCGRGWFRSLHQGPYVGIDGTATRHADIVADLRKYKSSTPGLWLRHVLEHNWDWRLVLDNAVASAEQKIAIIVFTPNGEGEQLGYTEELDVPDIALPHEVIADTLRSGGFVVDQRTVQTGSHYGEETIFLGVKG
jgi:hypothetical protein